MNRALWMKAVADAWVQLLISWVLLCLFSWVFVWLMSQLPLGAMATMLRWLPDFMKSLMPESPEALATPTGQLSFLYIHVVTQIVCVAWAVGRGSDPVAGEIGRGTMDLIASLPVRRVSVLVPPAVIAALGAAILMTAILAGTGIGLQCFSFAESVSIAVFLPAAVNLFCLTFFLTEMTAMIATLMLDRWRTIAISGAIFVLATIIEFVRRVWSAGAWLKYLTFMSAFRPQGLVLVERTRVEMFWTYNGTLLALGLACFIIQAIVFNYRDLPTPR